MNFLLEQQIKPFLQPKKSVDLFIGFEKLNEFDTIKWLSISRHKNKYEVNLHHVFDDRSEIESIYDFEAVDPDEMHGEEIGVFNTYEEAKNHIDNNYKVNWNKCSPFGYLDQMLGN